MEKIYIFGHKNPDTDSVCGSISLSYLKNKLGIKSEPRILGSINPETEYALKKFKTDVPEYLNDVKVQIKDVDYNKSYMINQNEAIIDAFNLMHEEGITGLPLVDDKKKFKGYVSLKEIAADMIYNENLNVNTSFDNLLKTLDAVDYLKYDDNINGYAYAATFDDATFIKDIPLDEQSILIVGDREAIINYALNSHVKLIIMVYGKRLTEHQLELARKNHINVISSRKSSYKVARVLCLANPIKSIQRGQTTTTFDVTDYLSDFDDITSKLKHTNYPILNNKEECLGMLRTIDAHKVNRKKVILVDHNMMAQSVDGLNEADILEIIDHHNIGDIITSKPINFRNMGVGSVCTIIYFLYQESGIEIPSNIAGLMLSGIVSDTLLLQSPTTTDVDRKTAEELASIAGVSVKQYGLDLLESGISIDNLNANQIIFKDNKEYEVNDKKILIGQIFTTDFEKVRPRMDELIEELNNLTINHNYDVCALFVTNYLTNDSNVIFSDKSKDTLSIAYGIDNISEGELLKGVVSRKKQMVPNIMDVISD